MNDVIDLID